MPLSDPGQTMNQRIILVNPPYPFEEMPSPPLGLLSLASFLMEYKNLVKLDDYVINRYSSDKARLSAQSFSPDFIGATAVTMNVKSAIRILADYKAASPLSRIVLGGPHASFDAEAILAGNRHIDFIVRGEGEVTVRELLDSPASRESLFSIDGLSWRDGEKIIHNKNRGFIDDVNILPMPARGLAQMSKYRALGLAPGMVTSRGCPFECIFCTGSKMIGRRVRYFGVERVLDEFESIAGYGFDQINIVDDLFTSNQERCIEICEGMIRRGIRHKWTAFARVDTVTLPLLKKMREAGCTMLCFGIESGNQGILDRVRKKTTLEAARKAMEICSEAGIVPMSSYIVGLPGESPETVEETMRFAESLNPLYGFHILSPFPGTEVRIKSSEYGLNIFCDDWDRYDANSAVSETDGLKAVEIERIVNVFNGRVQAYVDGIIKRYLEGNKLTGDELHAAEKMMNMKFTSKLIRSELLENYSGVHLEKISMIEDDFADYLSSRMEMSSGEIRMQIKRLLNTGAIAVAPAADTAKFIWL